MNLHKSGGIHRVFVLLLACLAVTACSFNVTTAHISDLKIFKDKAKKHATDEFGPHDTVYAEAIVSNVPSKVTLKFQLFAVKVDGQPANAALPSLNVSVDLPSDGDGNYTLSPPDAGWPAGKYRVDVAMLVEGGEQKDSKSAPFDVVDDN